VGGLAIGVLAGGALIASAAVARSGDEIPPPPPRVVKQPKLSAELAQVLRAELENGRGLAVARAKGLQVVGGRIRVVVEARGTRSAVSAALRATGAKLEAWHAGLAQALVAPRMLGTLSRATAVAQVRRPQRVVTQ
jgi:hypothetical protein